MTEDSTPTLRRAYELLKGKPVDPQSIYGSASGSATTNSKQDEDEEQMKKLKALALFRAQTKSKQIDPPFSLVQKEYESVLRQVFATQAGDNVNDTRQTSSGVPHGSDETGIASSTTKPEKVGFVSQRGPDTSSQYSTRDQPIDNFSPTSIPPSQIGRVGNNRYPKPTYVTTAQVPGTQPKGDTFNAPYRDET